MQPTLPDLKILLPVMERTVYATLIPADWSLLHQHPAISLPAPDTSWIFSQNDRAGRFIAGCPDI